ncbi:MAG: M10 family metallopeptidase C-terminal domain-containing protein [Rhizobiaceae bacterium]|nr:M10 family metallopeptidase C-terminal domain-containing protein [Rhizobiaceae bacterium]MCV0408131.1 M10 family metallopeptidase C-terminal domain-containing protein [Rhizobiaceae bacterium]
MCVICDLAGREPGVFGCEKVEPNFGHELQNPGSDTIPDNTSTTQTIATRVAKNGFVNFAGDEDWYAINLEAGRTYTFRVEGVGQEALRDSFVTLYNSSGVAIQSDDDSGPLRNAEMTFTATTSGTYYVGASGYGSQTGEYLLTASPGSSTHPRLRPAADHADYIQYSYWRLTDQDPRQWADNHVTFNLTGLEPERAVLARLAFQTWAEVSGLTFTETSGSADITIDDTQSGASSSSTVSGGSILSSTINVDSAWDGGSDAIDSYTFQTFIHEIGHSLGLGHSGAYNNTIGGWNDATYGNDSWQMSVMSYLSQDESGQGSYRYVMTPMMADILAMQRMYGGTQVRHGDTVYGHNATTGSTGTGILYNFDNYSTAPAFTIYDTGGTDTLDASGYSNDQTIILRGGEHSSIGGLTRNIGIYLTSFIENAIGGSGNDHIYGNSGKNRLEGGVGSDHLYGGTGADVLIGGPNTDFARYDDADYGNLTIRLDLPQLNTGAAAGDSYHSIEGLIGGAGNDLIVGNSSANRLYGGPGNDQIWGKEGDDYISGGAGSDHMYGGLGADHFEGGPNTDFARYDAETVGITISLSGAGTGSAAGDTYSSVEGLVGGQGNDLVVGDFRDNYLYGSGGNDTIRGDAGDDHLYGGVGSDRLYGGSGTNRLDGGPNTDFAVYGGGYNDPDFILRLDNPALNVGTGGVDTYVSIEGLIGGNGHDQIHGDGGANYLYGNGGNDHIYGQGGNDYISGGVGSDHLYGGAGADHLNGGPNTDFARYDDANHGNLVIRFDRPDLNTGVAAGDTYENVEALVAGAGNDTVVGNAADNYLYGGGGNDYIYAQAGDDYISGGSGNDFLAAGSGNDRLYGGAGIDRFVFNTTLNAPDTSIYTNVDHIEDFTPGHDTIILDSDLFGLPEGSLAPSAFTTGNFATDPDHVIVFNNYEMMVYYHPGTDSGAGYIPIASVTSGLTSADFFVI